MKKEILKNHEFRIHFNDKELACCLIEIGSIKFYFVGKNKINKMKEFFNDNRNIKLKYKDNFISKMGLSKYYHMINI
jgi:hypothetical protein